MKKIILLLAISLKLTTAHPAVGKVDHETDGEKSRKIIGQSVVTSVSVVMNGNEEPQFTDAVGKTVPRPLIMPPHVASPINLLNPDRYEFYTFNDKGELVKRLMTLSEIQSIVANGNGALISDNDPHESSQSVILNTIPLTNHDNSDTKVQDIVDNVQNVLSREMENNKNLSSIPQDLLDTPNVSSSWSMILPAIFGNTGDEILPHKPINMTPETEVIDTTTTKRVSSTRRPITKAPVSTTRISTTTSSVPHRQTTKVEQKITQSSSTTTTLKKKKPATTAMPTKSTMMTTKRQTVKQKPKPTSTVYRSTTRRPIAPVTANDLPSIKEQQHHQQQQHIDETTTTKTVLITSRPYVSTQQTTRTTTRRPTISTTLKAVEPSTTRRTTTTTLFNKIPASSLVKDSDLTMIEMKPIVVESKTERHPENESERVKVTQTPSTVLSTMSRIPSSTMQSSSTTTSGSTKNPSTTAWSTTKRVSLTETKAPSSSSPTVLITTTHPLTTASDHKTTSSSSSSSSSSTVFLTPVRLETVTTRKPITKLSTAMNTASTSSSDDALQDLAISQIIGSLQNDNFNLNHFFKPYGGEEGVEAATTTVTPIDEGSNEDDEITTTQGSMEMFEKSAEDINLAPDRVYINNQLYIDERDPIVKEIPTTTEWPSTNVDDDMTTTIESDIVMEETTAQSAEDESEEMMSTTKKQDISLENSEVMQAIEQLLREQHKSKNKLQSENLDVLGFDDDDETEIKLASTLESKKNLTQSEFNTKAATVASFINTKFIEKHSTTTELPVSDESDTTIPTILSEALSSVIKQMLREQELRKAPTEKVTRPTPTSTPSSRLKPQPTTPASTAAVANSSKREEVTTTKAPEATEPSLDDLNKLLHHYQELSSKRDELESLSLLRGSDASTEEETTTSFDYNTERLEVEIIEEKSSVQNSKIFSEIDSTTTVTATPELETTTQNEEFTTFFYVSDDNSVESDDDGSSLGAFTTEQFVASEKRISDRKSEDHTTTNVPSSSSEEDEDDGYDDVVQSPGELVSSVLSAIGITQSEEDDDDDEEETTTTDSTAKYEEVTGKSNESNTAKSASESEEEEEEEGESDEVVSAISSISSTLDRTLTTDIKTDFSLTSKIADSLISVADTISETLTGEGGGSGGSENESDESTDKLLDTDMTTTITPLNADNVDEREKLMSISEAEEESTTVEAATEATTTLPETTTLEMSEEEDERQQPTTVVSIKKTRPRLPVKHNKQNKESVHMEKDNSSPMIQLSIIRKEDSLEQMDVMTPHASIPTAVPSTAASSMEATKSVAGATEGNFIKIGNIDTMSAASLKSTDGDSSAHGNIKPIYIHRLSATIANGGATAATTSSSLPENGERQDSVDDSTEEIATERVPLIEKASKETIAPISTKIVTTITKTTPTTSDRPLMMASDENLVQIEVQTKTPAMDNKIITTTLSNAQNIKNTIKMSQQQHHQQIRPSAPIDLSASSHESLGLAASTAHISSDLRDFSKLCNELAFTFWKSITADGISQSRSVIISPFALTSTLSMIFLGARGQTSGEMNDLLKLDDTVSFNPHVVFRNISESVEQSRNSGIAAAAFARELYSDRSKGKLLPYFKEKAQQFYGAHVEEVNFNVINDILRRRTNLLVKRHTYNKIKEYLKTNNIWVNEPLAAVSANVFMTDCSKTTNSERDGEMFFQVSPAIRQRRLVPIPAAVYRSGFTAGYDPVLDATAVAFGDDLQSTILVMPGQQGTLLPGDNLERLESAFLESDNAAWERLLTTFMERPGLEVQIPRFSHRSLINTTYALQQMGLKDIFDANKADLRGLTGATTSDLYFSDLLQINQFTTCGEDKIGDSHHIEIYPSPALKKGFATEEDEAKFEMATAETNMQYKSLFYDPIYDSRYMNVPLSLRPRQARLPENPRLRFDRPFLYFVRHNPTNIILFMGRFNPRLLP